MRRTLYLIGLILAGTLMLAPAGSAAPDATDRIFFDPPTSTAQQGDTITVYLTLDSSVSTIHGYRVKFVFDTTVVRLDDIEPTDEWLDIAGGSSGQWFFWKDTVDQDNGQWHIDLFSYFFYQEKYIDGYSTIAELTFIADQFGGISSLEFYDHLLEDTLLNNVPVATDDAMIFICPVDYIPGNVNGDPEGTINITDLTYFVSYLFGGGPAPVPTMAGDNNCDQTVNIADLTYLVNYLFGGGPMPCDPCET